MRQEHRAPNPADRPENIEGLDSSQDDIAISLSMREYIYFFSPFYPLEFQ